jgi:hypothetical protein
MMGGWDRGRVLFSWVGIGKGVYCIDVVGSG